MTELLSVGIEELMPDPSQPRKTFIQDAINRLAASILARGVQQPLRVLRDADRQCWLILTGESRYRAARLAGLTHVPCIPVQGQLSEADRLADRLTENMLRDDLPPMEEAAGIARLKALKGCNSKGLVEEYGFSAAAISRAEALVSSLPPDIQAMVGMGPGLVPPSAAYEISRLPDDQSKRELAQAVAARKLTRDQTAEAVRSRIGKKNVKPKESRLACKVDGVSISLSADTPLQWDLLLYAIRRLHREAARLKRENKDVATLAQVLRAS